MTTKLMLVLALALGTSACVTDDDESDPSTQAELEDPPLPPGEFPDDTTCGENALKGDGACLPD